MPEIYIPLEDAACFEEIDYEAMKKRVQRGTSYKTKSESRESGKPKVLVAVSSLSSKARKAHRAVTKVDQIEGDEILVDSLDKAPVPWYVTVDLNWYIEKYKPQYYKAIEQTKLMIELNNYTGDDKTGFTADFAKAHGMTQRTLYRMSENYLTASAWALKYERLTGGNYEYFKVLALCRKPKHLNQFPSISAELKALIENIWFDKKFRANRGSIEMLYTKIEEVSLSSGIEYPSYPTVARYIQYLMDERGGRSAAFLAERGTREWKNKMMVKGERDIKSIPVMGIIQGDEHTFDCWVSYTHSNGKTTAVRPKLVAWVDMRSRVIMGDVMCLDGNAQILKQSFVKLIYSYGVPEYILIDNKS